MESEIGAFGIAIFDGRKCVVWFLVIHKNYHWPKKVGIRYLPPLSARNRMGPKLIPKQVQFDPSSPSNCLAGFRFMLGWLEYGPNAMGLFLLLLFH